MRKAEGDGDSSDVEEADVAKGQTLGDGDALANLAPEDEVGRFEEGFDLGGRFAELAEAGCFASHVLSVSSALRIRGVASRLRERATSSG